MSVYLSLIASIIMARHFSTSLYLKRFQFCFLYEKLLLWELQWQCLIAVLLRWLKKNSLVRGCHLILPHTIGKELANFVFEIGEPCSQTEAGRNVSFHECCSQYSRPRNFFNWQLLFDLTLHRTHSPIAPWVPLVVSCGAGHIAAVRSGLLQSSWNSTSVPCWEPVPDI